MDVHPASVLIIKKRKTENGQHPTVLYDAAAVNTYVRTGVLEHTTKNVPGNEENSTAVPGTNCEQIENIRLLQL